MPIGELPGRAPENLLKEINQSLDEMRSGPGNNPFAALRQRLGLFFTLPPDSDRRNFIINAAIATAAVPFAIFPDARQIPETEENLSFLNTARAIIELQIDPEHFIFDREKDDQGHNTGRFMFSFLSGRTDLLKGQNTYPAKASRVTVYLDKKDDCVNLAKFVLGTTRVWNGIKAAAAVGTGAIAMTAGINRGDQSGSPGTQIIDPNAPPEGWKPGQPGTLIRLSVLGVGGFLLIRGCKGLWDKVVGSDGSKQGVDGIASLTPSPTSPLPTSRPDTPIPTPYFSPTREAFPTTPSNGPTPTPVEIVVNPVPEIPINFKGTYIDSVYLEAQGQIIDSALQNNNANLEPQTTPVPPDAGNGDVQNDSLQEEIDYAKQRWNLRTFRTGKTRVEKDPPLDVLRLAIANNPREGIDRGLNYYQEGDTNEKPAFAGLSLYRERLTGVSGVYTTKESYPHNLVLKDGAGITIVGRAKDGSIVVAFEENLPRIDGSQFIEPRIRFAILSPKELGDISSSFLPNLKYYINEPDRITFTDTTLNPNLDRVVELNTISDELMEMITEETGYLWVEQYANPEGPPTLFPKPNVPRPSEDLLKSALPQGLVLEDLLIQEWDNPEMVGNPEGKRIYLRDPNTKYIVLVAKYDNTTREWGWREVTMRDKIDLLSIELGAVSGIDYLQSWHEESARMRPVFLDGFNLFVSDYEALWYNPGNTGISLRPSENSFYFDKLDQIVDFSAEIDAKTQVHHLLIGYRKHLPQWLLDIEDEFIRNGTSLEDRKAILYPIVKNHIQSLMSRYRGRIQEWSVVNEFLGTPWWNNFWRDNLGTHPEWILKAFQWAQEADPDAMLILNDGGFEYGPNSGHSSDRGPKIFEVAKHLKDAGVPLTIGFQMHVKARDFIGETKFRSNFDKLRQNIKTYKDIGVPVVITELDVDLHSVGGTKEERYELQANIYREIFKICFEYGIDSISVFQFPDRLNWLEGQGSGGGSDSDPTMYDDNYQPKPALIAIDNLFDEVLVNTS